MNYNNRGPFEAPFTQLLLDHGANTTIRASLKKQLHEGYAPKYDTSKAYEYRNVTAVEWGQQFHAKVFVSEPAIALILERRPIDER
jgi:hypothetical protein